MPVAGRAGFGVGSPAAFDARADVNGPTGVVTLRGEVDISTAPTVRAALRAVIEAGCRDVILDLGNVDFMDASGLGVMADIVRRLRPSGALTVRSPSDMVRRMLAITGLASFVSMEAGGDAGDLIQA